MNYVWSIIGGVVGALIVILIDIIVKRARARSQRRE
jgi:hypothetical protein